MLRQSSITSRWYLRIPGRAFCEHEDGCQALEFRRRPDPVVPCRVVALAELLPHLEGRARGRLGLGQSSGFAEQSGQGFVYNGAVKLEYGRKLSRRDLFRDRDGLAIGSLRLSGIPEQFADLPDSVVSSHQLGPDHGVGLVLLGEPLVERQRFLEQFKVGDIRLGFLGQAFLGDGDIHLVQSLQRRLQGLGPAAPLL